MKEFFESIKKRATILKEQYPALRMWSDTHAIISHQKFEEDHTFIREFIEPVDANKVASIIGGEFSAKTWVENIKNSKFVFIEIKHASHFIINKIEERMSVFNYHSAGYNIGYDLKYKFYQKLPQYLHNEDVVIQFEPSKDTQIESEPFTYHFTPDFNWKKIRTLGLTPKTQSKLSNHPGRIYLVNKLDENNFEELAIELWDKSKNKNIIGNMELLEIDMSKLRNHKFYEDPNFHFYGGEAIYTYENIPPYTITHIKSILVNPTPEKPGPNPYIK